MLVREFLETVIGIDGLTGLAWKEGPGFQHRFFDNIRELAALADERNDKGLETYHICAQYSAPKRVRDNVQAVKSIWLDLDCGEGKPYPDKREALQHLVEYTKAVSLPGPLIVDSGHGVHAYWPLKSQQNLGEWQRLADALKRSCVKYGLKADLACTADAARIMRLPYSKNLKKEPKSVKILRECQAYDANLLLSSLTAHAPVPKSDFDALSEKPAYITGELPHYEATKEFFKPTADALADACGAVGKLRDTKGNIPEPLWWRTLGALKFCSDGTEKAHEWSSGHPSYTKAETQAKLDGWGDKPPLCSTFEAECPQTCQSCPLYQKIKTPLFSVKPPEPEVSEVINDSPLPVGMAEIYKLARYKNGQTFLSKKKKTGEDTVEWDRLTSPAFVVTHAQYDTNGARYMSVAAIKSDFTLDKPHSIPLNQLMSNNVGPALAYYGIVVEEKMAPKVRSYLKDWLLELNATNMVTEVPDRFGWLNKDTAFFHGTTRITEKEQTQYTPLDALVSTADAMENPGADSVAWATAVEELYNTSETGRHRLAIVASFAAPLYQLLRCDSTFMHLYSDTTGVGKTMVEKTALSVWGDPEKLIITNTTNNALINSLQTYSHLPVVYDEMTKMDMRFLRDLVYSVTDNKPKQRLNTEGKQIDTGNQGWRTIFIGSSNISLAKRLRGTQFANDALLARILEVDMDKQITYRDDTAELERDILENCGAPGREYMQYVLDNKDVIRKNLRAKAVQKANEILKDHDPSHVRFWKSFIVTGLVALRICQNPKLGLLSFDMNDFIDQVKEVIMGNHKLLQSVSVKVNNAVSDLMQEIGPGLFTVSEERPQSKKPTLIPYNYSPGQRLTGRFNETECTLWVPERVVEHWAHSSTKNISLNMIENELTAAGKLTKKINTTLTAYVNGIVKQPKETMWCIQLPKDGMTIVSQHLTSDTASAKKT